MNKAPFRQQHPKRTCVKEYPNYKKYKNDLRTDFNQRCGYTDCPDNWFGGARTFHIDHFLPKKKYPKLEHDYSNLVYSCSYVNILKSDDEENFLDPCAEDFNKYFYRTDQGEIKVVDTSIKAVHMYDKLQLYLQRYSIIWRLEKIHITLKELQAYRKELSKEDEHYSNVIDLILELDDQFHTYIDYLAAHQ